jgi:hypothetical protein
MALAGDRQRHHLCFKRIPNVERAAPVYETGAAAVARRAPRVSR